MDKINDEGKIFKSEYTRTTINKVLYHNNRCDNVRKIIYKDNLISERFQLSDENIAQLCNIYNQDLEFPADCNVGIESFKILELLGKGSFGEVYLAELLSNKKKYAIKVLNKSKILSQNIVRYVVTERNVLSNIKHPYIVRLYYAFQTDEYLYLILEYCEGKDLCYHLRKSKFFEEETVKIIASQLILAVEELHRHNIIYRYIIKLFRGT
jgi:serine/threonine protein kinase